MTFSFTRNPSTKTKARTELATLAKIDNTLVIVGTMAASGASATAGIPYVVENFGDEVAALAEVSPLFGAASELTEMVIAAIKAVKYSNMDSIQYPILKVIPMANADTDYGATLAANINVPMPFLAVAAKATVSEALSDVRDHLQAISGEDRGRKGQFGSFGFMGMEGSLSESVAIGVSTASQFMMFPWLRDTAGTPANKAHALAAAVGAICAANPAPYLPLNEIEIGGLAVPASLADHHTEGDTGSVALGLASGILPLPVNFRNKVTISRTVTSLRTTAELEDTAYYDMQDWQKLYAYRTNAYARANEPRYKRAHASNKKILALKSELIGIAKTFETLEMFQEVDKLVAEWTVVRDPLNRHAAVYTMPVNAIPGFHNKGLDIVGTNKYDSFVI